MVTELQTFHAAHHTVHTSSSVIRAEPCFVSKKCVMCNSNKVIAVLAREYLIK